MNDEEEKKVDTQTTQADEANADKQEANTQSDEQDKVTKAFGNEAETKNEDTKSKKSNSVAKANEDGSITFKSQTELNTFINKMYAKGAKSVKKEQSAAEITEGKDATKEEQSTAESEDGTSENSSPASTSQSVLSDIALALIDADVNPKKARRAARLVNLENVLTDGALDESKLSTEIQTVISEWPELKNTTQENKEEKGFKFGASQQQTDDEDMGSKISSIFGNKKD